MGTIYFIAAGSDSSFIETNVLPVLPCHGYAYWLPGVQADSDAGENMITRNMNQCQAIITVVSTKLLQSRLLLKEINLALESRIMHIVVMKEALTDRGMLPERLWTMPLIDYTSEEKKDQPESLVNLLPVQTMETETKTAVDAKPIPWNEGIFNFYLKQATFRNDHSRAQWLISIFTFHLENHASPYSGEWAVEDLKLLKKVREFSLMINYGDAVLQSGTKNDTIKKLFAQALIETAQYEKALEILNSIVEDNSSPEFYEARGLIGRIYKQQYVNDPHAKGSASLLISAIKAYRDVFVENDKSFWHGVNAASCLYRLQMDGLNWEMFFYGLPESLAGKIVEELNSLSADGLLDVWDCASKVEALVVLKRYNEAKEALDIYLHHPDLTAFEVSSTYRQFDQVLQLDRIPEGAEILSLLRSTMERYRAGTVLNSNVSSSDQARESDENKLKSLTIRISDTSWDPGDIPGFSIQSRLGMVVTARGTNEHVRRLLHDPMVISVEESRPVGLPECNRSIPYIRVSSQYVSHAGNYEEKGEHALVAIIDDSIDVLHQAFLDANGNSRILGVWDQTDQNGTAPIGFNYGTFHDNATIAGYIQTRSVPPNLGRNGQRHGTHVASIAAGRAVGSFAGGVAPDAQLLIVIPDNKGSIGYSNSHIDALFFIDKFAADLNLPVVVNLSQGMNAGAHDGKSSLEAAFDGFSNSGRKAGRVVVKSAGNEREKNGHAKITLKSKSMDELKWARVKGADPSERIELWWSSGDEVRFRLREPIDPLLKNTGQQPNWSDWVGTANPELFGSFVNGGPYKLVYTKRHIDNGDSLLSIELGEERTDFVPAGLGEWLLEIECIETRGNSEMHCWIERGQGSPTSFLVHVDEEMTLSIPGTAETVITVGAVEACSPIVVDKSSSYGPTRERGQKPEVCAPGVNVSAADAGTGNGVFILSGTSMAAPHVTGAIALLLSRAAKSGKKISANQVSKAIAQKTQNYDGSWDRGQGFGVLDVSALLAAFE